MSKCPRCGATDTDEAEMLCQPTGDDCPGVAALSSPDGLRKGEGS